MNGRLVTLGADAVSKAFGVAAATIEARTILIVRRYGELLKTKIQGHASGRPGPNAPTGDYRRSWTAEPGRVNGDPASIVGTNKPQGRRLEYGFMGTDALGRHYSQPPYPHVRPAMLEIEGPFADSMLKAAGDV